MVLLCNEAHRQSAAYSRYWGRYFFPPIIMYRFSTFITGLSLLLFLGVAPDQAHADASGAHRPFASSDFAREGTLSGAERRTQVSQTTPRSLQRETQVKELRKNLDRIAKQERDGIRSRGVNRLGALRELSAGK